jgi:hypothetical protein
MNKNNNDDDIDLSSLYNFVGQYKLYLIFIVSILSSLFMPPAITFYVVFPLFILSMIILVSYGDKNIKLFFGLTLGIVGAFVLSIGLLYILAFIVFIHVFPTFVVILGTLLVVQYFKTQLSKKMLILMFIVISTIFGLNTTILDLIFPHFKVEKNIGKMLQSDKNHIFQASNEFINLPNKYNPFDFLSFGANEGCMCGYWEEPKISYTNIEKLLQNEEIIYTKNKEASQKIEVDYDEHEGKYTLQIRIKENNTIISNLLIQDKLPLLTKVNADLDSFGKRFEFLYKHNFWNAVLYYYHQRNIENIIQQFIHESINIQVNKYEKKELKAQFLKESDEEICSMPRVKKNLIEIDRSSFYISPELFKQKIYINRVEGKDVFNSMALFNIDDIVHPVNIPNSDFAFATENFIYSLKYRLDDNHQVRMYQFLPNGELKNELLIQLSKDKTLVEPHKSISIDEVYIDKNLILIKIVNRSDKKLHQSFCKSYVYEIINNIDINF